MMQQKGIVISVDFELDWGYTNLNNPLEQKEVLEGLNKLMNLFEKHQVKTTWAIVGELFENETAKDNSKRQLQWIRKNLINNEFVEIASHTHQHIFCDEKPLEVFRNDLLAMNEVAKKNKIAFTSIVFPRNQFNKEHLAILKENKYTHFRGVLDQWYLKTDKYSNESAFKRNVLRGMELVPFKRDVIVKNLDGIIAISDSRFFRFFSPSIIGKIVSKVYLRLLKREMKKSIKRGRLYHVWFHPHNIIKKPNGFKQLDLFLTCFNEIRKQNKNTYSFKFSEINN